MCMYSIPSIACVRGYKMLRRNTYHGTARLRVLSLNFCAAMGGYAPSGFCNGSWRPFHAELAMGPLHCIAVAFMLSTALATADVDTLAWVTGLASDTPNGEANAQSVQGTPCMAGYVQGTTDEHCTRDYPHKVALDAATGRSVVRAASSHAL